MERGPNLISLSRLVLRLRDSLGTGVVVTPTYPKICFSSKTLCQILQLMWSQSWFLAAYCWTHISPKKEKTKQKCIHEKLSRRKKQRGAYVTAELKTAPMTSEGDAIETLLWKEEASDNSRRPEVCFRLHFLFSCHKDFYDEPVRLNRERPTCKSATRLLRTWQHAFCRETSKNDLRGLKRRAIKAACVFYSLLHCGWITFF